MAAEAGDKLPEDLATIRKQTEALIKRLRTVDRETAEPALTYLQAQLYRDFVSKFYSLQRNLNRQAAQLPARELEFFEKQIRPILADRCYECHSAAKKIAVGSR